MIVVTYDEINVALTNGLNFFQLLEAHQQSARESFYPARTIIGRFSQNPPMPYVVEMKPNGGFSISTEGIGRQTDASYVRQERINNLLCGRVLAAYLNVNKPGERAALRRYPPSRFRANTCRNCYRHAAFRGNRRGD